MTEEISNKEASSLALPEAGRGFEEPTRQEDLIVPRAKLLQALSPEVVERKDGCAPGVIINSLSKEILPGEFVPVFKFTYWVRFNPRNTKDPAYDPAFGPGDMLWRSSDPYDKRVLEESRFGEDGQKPLATTFLSFFSLFPGVAMPIVVQFSSTSYKAGRSLLSLAQFTGGDMFAWRYRLGAKQESNDMGTYFVLTVERVGKASEAEFKAAEGLWEKFHKKPVKLHEEAPEEAEAGGEKVPF